MMRLKENIFFEFFNLSKIHGSIYTFWMGTTPMVVITDLEIAKEAFSDMKNEIAGRPDFKLCQFVLNSCFFINFY